MRHKLKTVPPEQKAEWRTVVHLELNAAGEARVRWHPIVLANPHMVNEILQALVCIAEQASEHVAAATCDPN
jgi:hypothetical protein